MLAAEVDLLNAALSNAGNIQDKTEKLWRMAEEQATTLGRALTRANQKLEKYDESALAEARRLAVLQHSNSNTGKSYEELVQWLSTGQWPDLDVKEMGEEDHVESGITMVAVEGEAYRQAMLANYQNGFVAGREERIYDPTPFGSAQSNAYAHGWVKGWNELLNKIQARLSDSTQPQPDDQFEYLRHSFNRTEAM